MLCELGRDYTWRQLQHNLLHEQLLHLVVGEEEFFWWQRFYISLGLVNLDFMLVSGLVIYAYEISDK
jgi:hypothetical protein